MTLYQPKADTAEDFYRLSRYKRQIDWLKAPCYDAGLTTLLNEFKKDNERELLLELLGNVAHYKISDRIESISTLVEYIEKLNPKTTLIVATAKDSESDGSKAWQYFFKFFLAQSRQWNESCLKPTLVSSYGALSQKRKESYKDVIIFDDFIGSGNTMVTKVNEFFNQLSTRNIKPPTVQIFALAGMEFGINHIKRELNLNVVCPVSLKKGISEQHSNTDEISHKIKLMESMELSLKEHYECGVFESCSLGYGQSEALYQVQFTNCSNNVFPIFWVGPKGKGRYRNTLFYRL